MLRRQRRSGAGSGLVLRANRTSAEKLLAAAVALAGPEDDLVILVCGGTPSDVESAGAVARALGGIGGRKLRVETAAAVGTQALLRKIERLDPVMLVLDSDTDNRLLRELLADTRCDVLLVR